MDSSLVKFLDDNREFIDGFTPAKDWFMGLESRLEAKVNNRLTFLIFFAELSFDILALREPGMAVITYYSNHRYSIGIEFSGGDCWECRIFSVLLQRGNISFEELKERIKGKVKETVFGLDRSKEVICDLIDKIPERRMVEI